MRAFSIVTLGICLSFSTHAEGPAARYVLTDLGPIGPAGEVVYIARNGLVAGAAQQPDQRRVRRGHAGSEDRRSRRVRKAGGVFEIFERPGKPVQRPDLVSAREPRVGFVCKRQAFVVVQLRDDGVQCRIESIDARQVSGHHLAGRELPRPNQGSELAAAPEADVRVHACGFYVANRGPGCSPTRTRTSLNLRSVANTGEIAGQWFHSGSESCSR